MKRKLEGALHFSEAMEHKKPSLMNIDDEQRNKTKLRIHFEYDKMKLRRLSDMSVDSEHRK